MSDRSCHPRAAGPVLRAIVAAALLIAVGVPAAAQTAQPSESRQDAAADDAHKWFVMEDRPSLRLGDAVRVDLTSKVDLIVSGAPDVETDAHMEQRRIGVDGRLFDVIGFQVERELGDDERPWRDVFVELR